MRRFLDIFFCSVFVIFAASITLASQAGQGTRSGTAADFTTSFPWLVVALITALFAIIAWFVVRYDDQREKKINQAIKAIGETNESLAKATGKLDATINTLFERDRDIEHEVSLLTASVAGIKATCAARGKMCPLSGSKIVCLDRRDGEERREE